MNRRIVLGTAATALVLLGAWFFALWQPKGKELSDERAREAAALSEADALETQISQLKVLEADGPRLTATLDRLRSAVPDEPRLAQFILDANDAAVSSGVGFVSIAPAEPAPSKTPGLPPEIGLSLSIEGGYFQVLDFVEKLVDLQRVVVLDGVNVTPSNGDDGGPPDLSVALTGRMFTSTVPAAPAATPTGAPGTPGATTTTTTPQTTTTTVVPS